MDIIDVHIVRITQLTTETVSAADQFVAIDSALYLDGYPKKLSLLKLAEWVVNILLTLKLYTVKGFGLRADVPANVVFDYPFETDYIIIPTFVHSTEQTGLTITNETSIGFTVTANGADCTIDFMVIPITPIAL